MRNTIIAVLILCAWPAAAPAQSANWMRYQLGDGSAAVDLPAGVFTVDGGASGRDATLVVPCEAS